MMNITAVVLNPKDYQLTKMIFRDYMFDLPENKFHTLCDRALVIKGMMCPCAFCSPRRDSVRPLYTESHPYIKRFLEGQHPKLPYVDITRLYRDFV